MFQRKIDKKFWLVFSFLMLVLILNRFYPTEEGNVFQGIVSALLFLIIFPALFFKFVLKEKLSHYGFQLSIKIKSILTVLLMLLVALLIFFIISKYWLIDFGYSLPIFLTKNFIAFLFSELTIGLSLVLIIEIFFRGFLQSFLSQYMGSLRGIFFQTLLLIIFVYFLGMTDMISWPIFQLILISPLAGWVFQKSNSWFYSWFYYWLFMIFSDAMLIYLKY